MFLKFFGLKKHTKRPYPTVIEELCHHFSLADLKKATNNFDQNNVIGEGGFGKIYKGSLQLDDHVATAVVAVKRMSKSSIQGLETFNREIELLCQLRHANLVTLIGFCLRKDERIIVYEYMSNGSLADRLLNSDHWEPLSWKKRLEICIGAARGLHYLHSGARRMVFHRDIKASNILLDENMMPKLSDFGLSLQGSLSMKKSKPIEVAVLGIYGYAAPEYIRTGSFTYKCDVYSFGMLLFEVVCAKQIYAIVEEMSVYMQQQPNEEIEMSNNGSESSYDDVITIMLPSYIMLKLQAEDIDSALVGNIAPECYAVYIDIIDRCLKYEPNERPIMGEVEIQLEHALTLQQEAENAKDTSNIAHPQQEE